jgi:hypothetical protein
MCLKNIFGYNIQYMSVNCHVEIICNTEKEPDRIPTIELITNHYNITPYFTVYGEDTRSHKYFPKYRQQLNTSAISLAINHITLLEKYKDSDKTLLIFESDVLCLLDFDIIDNKLNSIIESMNTHSIDFVFLGIGCFDSIDKNNYTLIENDIYKTGTSRCTEAYLIRPNGMRKYLDYFYNVINNHTAIDADYNLFFKGHPEIISCWLIPELFKQGSRSIYKSLVPVESDTSVYSEIN